LSPRRRGTIKENLGSRFHGKPWIPASAGMTTYNPKGFFRRLLGLILPAKGKMGMGENDHTRNP
jgi:hypothetical protein